MVLQSFSIIMPETSIILNYFWSWPEIIKHSVLSMMLSLRDYFSLFFLLIDLLKPKHFKKLYV